MLRVSLVGVVALAGCYLQPTVFDSERGPTVESHTPSVSPDVPVGCITHELGYGRRGSGRWWLGSHRATYDEVDRALTSSPLTAPLMVRARRDHRLGLGLFFAGMALSAASIAGMVAWIHSDEQSREPLVMLAPAFGSYALGLAAVPISIRGDKLRRRAIDTYNDAAARENRCPP